MRTPCHIPLFITVAAVVVWSAVGNTTSPAAQTTPESSSAFETVATLPLADTENIFETADGSFYITGMDARSLVRVTPDRRVETFVTLPSVAFVFGVVGMDDSFALTVSERPYFRGIRVVGQPRQLDFSDIGAQVVLVDKAGHVTATIPGPKGAFFNGIAAAGRGMYLIADSANGIVQVDTGKKQIQPWFAHEAFAPTDPPRVGVNGIKVHDGWVYVSARGAIYRVPIGADGRPNGGLSLFAHGARADDFDIAKDGTLYLSSLTTVSPRGEIKQFRQNVPTGPAVAVSRDGRWLYWPTRGLEGQQKLLRAAIR